MSSDRIMLRLQSPYMRGQDVLDCQRRLTDLGYPCGTLDGIYGPKAAKAVRAFQQANGLTADGICGPKTWAALCASLGVPEDKPTATAAGLVAYVRAQLGQPYVWGGHGQANLTDAKIIKMDTSRANAQRSIRYIQALKGKGVTSYRCFDCSGLISRYLYDLGLVTSKRNCNHLANMCRKVYKRAAGEDITAKLAPGDLVFRRNTLKYYHVGVYVGKGQVVEAKGRDDGVVLRDINASGKGYWNRYGRLKLLEE